MGGGPIAWVKRWFFVVTQHVQKSLHPWMSALEAGWEPYYEKTQLDSWLYPRYSPSFFYIRGRRLIAKKKHLIAEKKKVNSEKVLLCFSFFLHRFTPHRGSRNPDGLWRPIPHRTPKCLWVSIIPSSVFFLRWTTIDLYLWNHKSLYYKPQVTINHVSKTF